MKLQGETKMRIKGAMTVLKNRAKLYSMTSEELVQWLDNRLEEDDYIDETVKVLQAYEVYKQYHGYQWSGVNFETWVKEEAI